MKQIIVTILYIPETNQVGLTLGAVEGQGTSFKEVALALERALESITAGLPDAPDVQSGGEIE